MCIRDSNLAVGLTNRVMPQIQIFFVAIPVQITLGILALVAVISAGLPLFLENYENTFEDFMRGQ
jgi:flagellar biosynthetic protein FliR